MSGCRRMRMACALLLALYLLTPPANAQDMLPQRTDVAGSRRQTEFESEGIRLGPAIAKPELKIATGYDSNLFGLQTDLKSDGYTVVTPSLSLRSDWGDNGIDISGNANLTRYFRFIQQNTDEYAVHAGGRFVLDDWTVDAGTSLNRAAERRGTNGTPLSLGAPSTYRAFAQTVALKRTSGPMTFGLTVSHQDTSFSDITPIDGVPQSQSFRNSEQWQSKLEASFTPSSNSALSLFGQYQHGRVPAPNNFSNESLSAGGIVAIDIGIIRVQAEGAYIKRRFDNPLFRDFSGPIYNGMVSWFPTPLLSITARGSKTLENSGDPTAGEIGTQRYQLGIDYELLRNLLVHAEYGARHDRFPESARRDVSRTQNIKGEYQFNRFVAFAAYVSHECKNSLRASVEQRFCALSTGLSLTFRQ